MFVKWERVEINDKQNERNVHTPKKKIARNGKIDMLICQKRRNKLKKKGQKLWGNIKREKWWNYPNDKRKRY